jgi:hypothetical protein
LVWLLDHKALVEAEVLYDGFTVSCRGIAAPLIIARPLQCLFIYKTIGLAKKPISQGKNALLTLVAHVHHLWLAKELSLSDWQKTFVGKNCLVCS